MKPPYSLQLDLSMKDDEGGDLSSFITNGEWELIGKEILFPSFSVSFSSN